MFFFRRKKYKMERRLRRRKSSRNLVAVESPDRALVNMVNISETGIQISSPKQLLNDQLIEMTVNLAEEGYQFQALGKVVWKKLFSKTGSPLYHVGISFVELSQDAGSVIRHFVRSSFKAA